MPVLGRIKKELLNEDIDRFVRHRRRTAHDIDRNGADAESKCSVLSEEQRHGATELHVSDHGAVRAGQGQQRLGAVHPELAGRHDRLRRSGPLTFVRTTFEYAR